MAVLTLPEGENRLTPALLEALHGALDEVEAMDDPVALVVGCEGKIWSNGLDLDALTGADQAGVVAYLDDVHALFARVLSYPLPTVAAIGGHAFAAGAMLATCFDQRVMRSDRGYLCLPEVDLGLTFTPGMLALLQATLPAHTGRDAMLSGRRYGGPDAVAAGFVHEAVAHDEVLPGAVARAEDQAGKDRKALAGIKEQLFADALSVLRARR